MSTFNGIITEIPFIAVDYFGEENYFADIYFLSHIHSDHTRGLFETNFINHLKNTNKFVYTSALTKLMLEQKFSSIDTRILSQIKPLELKHLTLLSKDENTLSVVALPCGHCAGAVMFLFETNLKRILYTGDIRIENKGLSKFRILHTYFDESVPKKIDSLYLDTTFLNPSYDWFPLRRHSATKICEITKDWLNKDPNNLIFIKLPATCGSEQLFIEINEYLKQKIFVSSQYKAIYSRIPEMDGICTFDENTSRIHACQQTKCCERCTRCNKNKRLEIIPSALYWTKDKFISDSDQKSFVQIVNDFKIRVCYSSHSSYSEINDLLDYLKPKKIVACVESEDDFIKKFVKEHNMKSIGSSNIDCDKDDIRDDSELLFKNLRNEDSDNLSDASEDSLLLCTPPKKYPKLC